VIQKPSTPLASLAINPPSGRSWPARIRKSFVEVHRQQLRDGSELVRDILRSPEATSRLRPDDFITVILNLAHGLAVTQRILGAELSQKSTRSLVQSLFDHLLTSE
jgi:hypothetical protein